ncbi:MAG: hypothetical protein JWM09_243 [Francisellaceae bacterium]|nr:hypothetical protein [Francisellaceae bacterium]
MDSKLKKIAHYQHNGSFSIFGQFFVMVQLIRMLDLE